MARKRKRNSNSKGNKINPRVIKKRDLLLHKSSSDRVPNLQEGLAPDIILTTNKKRIKKPFNRFVSESCITNSLSHAVTTFCKKQTFVNTDPAWPGPVPDIIGEKTKSRRMIKTGVPFVDQSCITNNLSLPDNQSVAFAPEVPVKQYSYIERPNSPDILGPTYKKPRRKKSDAVPFVPKSCTIDIEQAPLLVKNIENYGNFRCEWNKANSDTIAKVCEETKICKISWLPLVVVVLLMFISIFMFLK
ncbi:hypothetical protein [Desulfotomaculum sp. 1211_IL3151]|uniref:hypothetical protein n=1 Tax=Desulfotomaculum sp. 1211_IL3151 TaxID=3084055 RepID=UPI002FDA7C4C